MSAAPAGTASPGRLRAARRPMADYVELTKPRITLLVLATAAAGFWLGSAGTLDVALLLHLLAGTALVASGTSAMNQVLELEVDALMARTRRRPLPAGRLDPLAAAAFAGLLAAAGVAWLALATNLLTAALAAATFTLYDLVYTPLKRVHSLATLVGAVPGALPILGGWTAATGEFGAGGWAAFGILFFWQLPHFLALAWIFRDDYRRAGLAMLTVGDATGAATRHQCVLYTLTLVPVSLLPAVLGLGGVLYCLLALGLGVAFVVRATAFARDPDLEVARRLFRFSLLYLPALLLGLSLDKAL